MIDYEIHICDFKRGKIMDVVICRNDNSIYCAKCFDKLRHNQIEEKTLREILSEVKIKERGRDDKHKHRR
jgi:hypothetical protein